MLGITRYEGNDRFSVEGNQFARTLKSALSHAKTDHSELSDRVSDLADIALSSTQHLSKLSSRMRSKAKASSETIQCWDVTIRSLLVVFRTRHRLSVGDRRYLLSKLGEIRKHNGGGVELLHSRRPDNPEMRIWSGVAEQLARQIRNDSSDLGAVWRRIWPFAKATIDLSPLVIAAAVGQQVPTPADATGSVSELVISVGHLLKTDVMPQTWLHWWVRAYTSLESWAELVEAGADNQAISFHAEAFQRVFRDLHNEYHRWNQRGTSWRAFAALVWPLRHLHERCKDSQVQSNQIKSTLVIISYLKLWGEKHHELVTGMARKALLEIEPEWNDVQAICDRADAQFIRHLGLVVGGLGKSGINAEALGQLANRNQLRRRGCPNPIALSLGNE